MNDSSRYRIALYTPEHRDGVARLQKLQWRGSERENAAHLEWKYRRGLVADRSFILLVLHDGEVVGTRGAIALRYEGGSPRHEFFAFNTADLLLDPAHRGVGLNREIGAALIDELAAREVPYALGWSAWSRPKEWLIRNGWKEVGSFDPHYTEPAGLLTRAAYRVARTIGSSAVPPLVRRYEYLRPDAVRNPAAALAAVPDRVVHSRVGRVTIAREPRPESMEELVARLGSDGRLRHVRDTNWFAWRFADPLACNRFVFVDTDRLEGYLVAQARPHRRFDHVAIVDLEAASPRVMDELLTAAVQHLGIDRLVLWCAGYDSTMRGTLAKHGFRPVPPPPGAPQSKTALLVRRFPGAEALANALGTRSVERLADWDFRMAYSDAY